MTLKMHTKSTLSFILNSVKMIQFYLEENPTKITMILLSPVTQFLAI